VLGQFAVQRFQVGIAQGFDDKGVLRLDRSAAGAGHLGGAPVGEHVADFFRSLFNGLHGDWHVAGRLHFVVVPLEALQPRHLMRDAIRSMPARNSARLAWKIASSSVAWSGGATPSCGRCGRRYAA
jgi:hypothetical protein